ncbi:MAG: O-methyltransferase, partial [Nitriliruptoraceae bacterium]
IRGDAATVLPRLSDGGYDLVVLQTLPAAAPELLEHARRLLRTGGVLVVRGALRPGEHAERLARLLQALADDPGFSSVVLPLDDGLALATREDVAAAAPPADAPQQE